MFHYVHREAKMEKHSLYIRSMEASIRNFLAIGDSNRKKHEGRKYILDLIISLDVLHFALSA